MLTVARLLDKEIQVQFLILLGSSLGDLEPVLLSQPDHRVHVRVEWGEWRTVRWAS